MTINKELFHKIADQIERSPQLYNQEEWTPKEPTKFLNKAAATRAAQRGLAGPCGGAFCIAGHAVAAAGYLPLVVFAGDDSADTWFATWQQVVDPATGETHQTPDLAEELLGLTPWGEEAGEVCDDEIFSADIAPIDGTVSDALRAVGDGAAIGDVFYHLNDRY